MTNDQFTDEQRAEQWLTTCTKEGGGNWPMTPRNNDDITWGALEVYNLEKAAFLAGMAAAAPTWIPVTPETMPPTSGWYVVYIRAIASSKIALLDVQEDGCVCLGCDYASTITHWMPLPAPPIK